MIETVSGVDSANIEFISEKNELAMRRGWYYKTVYKIDRIRSLREASQVKVNLEKDSTGVVIENPNIGLDKFSDVEIGLNELPIMRGGWFDRNDIYYSVDIKDSNISSVNIVIDEIINEDLSQQIMVQNKNILINNERKQS